MRNKANVVAWAAAKGILDNSTAFKQSLKTLEELTELMTALNNNDEAEIRDAYGDILVTLIIGAELANVDLEQCLEEAYNVIAKRTGKMVDGLFVKD